MTWTPDDIINLVTALGVIITPLIVIWLNRKMMAKVDEQGIRVKETAEVVTAQSHTIATLEKNTNSIKDALVAATAKASLAEGKAEGRAEQKAESKASPSVSVPGGTIEGTITEGTIKIETKDG